MKKIKYFILPIFIALALDVSAQSSEITAKINEVYGTYVSDLNDAQYSWLVNCYSRCLVIDESAVPEGAAIQSLEDVGLNQKYVSTTSVDETYDHLTFNPLKYHINFMDNKDQYFRIGTSSYILKVSKKES